MYRTTYVDGRVSEEKVLEYKKGKNKLLGYFVGESMKLSKGKANPKILNQILIKKLKAD